MHPPQYLGFKLVYCSKTGLASIEYGAQPISPLTFHNNINNGFVVEHENGLFRNMKIPYREVVSCWALANMLLYEVELNEIETNEGKNLSPSLPHWRDTAFDEWIKRHRLRENVEVTLKFLYHWMWFLAVCRWCWLSLHKSFDQDNRLTALSL